MEFPENLGELSVDELNELHTKLDEEFRSAPLSTDPAELKAAEELLSQRKAVGEELATRERLAELTRQQEELNTIPAEEDVDSTDEETTEELTTEDEAETEESEASEELSTETEEEAEVETTEELTSEETAEEEAEEPSTEELTSEEAPAEEAEAEETETEELSSETEEVEATDEADESAETTEELSDETVAVDDANDEEETETLTTEDDSEENMSIEKDGADLEQHRPEANAPKFNTAGGTGITAVRNVNGLTAGSEFASLGDFASAMHSAIDGMRHTSGNGRDQVAIGTVGNTLAAEHSDLVVNPGTDPFANFARMRQAVDMQGDSLVASGGICAPFDCNYDFFRTCVAKSPIEDAMPVIPAARGGIRYFKPFKPEAAGAVGTVTCADDAAGYESTPEWCGGPGPTPDKPCICVECPEIDECCVTAVSTCVRWGNLQWRTFPEHVEEFMHYVNVAFASEKETLYLDAINAASVPVDGIDTTYGAFRQALYNIKLAAEAYRCRNCMPENAPLQALVPKWLMAAIDVDRALSCCEGGGSIGNIFAECGISIVEYADSATGEDQQPLNIPQAAGPLNPWPAEASVYLFSPGSFVRLDGGQMDLGVVRDHILNRTNDFELFSEQWTGLCFLGCESVHLKIPMCVNGAAPDGVPALAC